MPTDVVMPQMGESVAEGTIVRWLKKPGDQVARDEPLFEISTDKVDAEIPSPAAGVLSEVRVQEGETVPIDTVVAVIGELVEKRAAPAPVSPPAAAKLEPAAAKGETDTSQAPTADATAPQATAPQVTGPQAPVVEAQPATAAPAPGQQASQAPSAPPVGPDASPVGAAQQSPAAPPVPGAGRGVDERIRQRSSPLVRKIAKDHNVDITKITGTGIAGRVTKDDILEFIAHEERAASPSAPAVAAAPAAPVPAPARSTPAGPVPGQVQPMSVMRKRIAEHMIASRRTSAHVHSIFEVSFARVAQVRAANKAEFEKAGAKLTYMSFIIKAAAEALRVVPVVNASIDGDNIVYHRDVNIGIAVALDWGLIVPVIKKADQQDLLAISRSIVDLAERARARQLKPDEVAGGTFTITNPGGFGALSGTPIINQPQVAILGVGVVEKRPVVIDDAIAIRLMAYLTIGYDHRLIDGAVADQFMSHIKHQIENWQ